MSTFEMDLDDSDPVVSDTDVPVIIDNKQLDSNLEAMIPVGNILKKIDDVTSDEFRIWLMSVLPMPSEEADRFMALYNKKKENTFDNIKVRKHIFDNVVKLHEYRWLFAMGRQLINEETKWN